MQELFTGLFDHLVGGQVVYSVNQNRTSSDGRRGEIEKVFFSEHGLSLRFSWLAQYCFEDRCWTIVENIPILIPYIKSHVNGFKLESQMGSSGLSYTFFPKGDPNLIKKPNR